MNSHVEESLAYTKRRPIPYVYAPQRLVTIEHASLSTIPNAASVGNSHESKQEIKGEVQSEGRNWSNKRHIMPESDEEDVKPVRKRTMQRRECVVCARDRAINQFPHKRKISLHGHGNDVCRCCFRTHVETQIESMASSEIPCPVCDVNLSPKEIELLTNEDSLIKYERRTIRFAMGEEEDFNPCLSSTCASSQIHVGGKGDNIFSCQACKQKFCLECEVPWHQDETCSAHKGRIREEGQQELDRQQREADETASLLKVGKISKPCPLCKSRLDKYTGCDHVTCRVCRHEFCWVCFAPYRDIWARGNHAHTVECAHYQAPPSASTAAAAAAAVARFVNLV